MAVYSVFVQLSYYSGISNKCKKNTNILPRDYLILSCEHCQSMLIWNVLAEFKLYKFSNTGTASDKQYFLFPTWKS